MMPTIVNCPECDQPVSLPHDAPPQARARCPLCAAEYPVEEALKGLPPALVLLDPPAEEPFEPLPKESPEAAGESLEELSLEGPGELSLEGAPEEAFLEESTEETPAEPTAMAWNVGDKNPDAPTEEGPRFDSWMPASEGEGYELDDGREGETAGSGDDGALIFGDDERAVALEDAPAMSELPAAKLSRKRRRPSILGQMIGVFGGGVVGLGLGYIILLWIGGAQKDFLKVGHKLPAFMVPAEFHPDGTDQASAAPTPTETTRVELPPRQFAADADGGDPSFDDLQDKFAGVADNNPSEPAESDQAPPQLEPPTAAPVMEDEPFAASEAPAEDPFGLAAPPAETLASAKPELPAFEPKLLSDGELLGGLEPTPEPSEPAEKMESEAAEAPEPIEPVEAPVVRVEVASAPTYTAEQLTAALGEVEKNQPKLLSGKLSDSATRKDVVAAFKAYCALGETVAFAARSSDEAQLQAIRKLAGEVAGSEQTLQDFGKIGNVWMTSDQRTKPGVILAGKVLAVKQQGAAHALWMAPYGHDETRVKVVTDEPPAVQPGGAAVVLGSILDDGQAVAGHEVTTGNQFAGEEDGAFKVIFSRLIVPAGGN